MHVYRMARLSATCCACLLMPWVQIPPSDEDPLARYVLDPPPDVLEVGGGSECTSQGLGLQQVCLP
jgi:hypothetical protein